MSSPRKFWEGLTRALGHPELQDDPRFQNRDGRQSNYDALKDVLAGIFRMRDREEWLARLRAEDVRSSPLNNLREVFDDPQVKFLGLRKELNHPRRGRVSVVGSAVRLSDTPVRISHVAPELGQDTEFVLRSVED